MADALMFVQFPHPGAEHQPAGTIMEWNRREHARKFLKARGRYIEDGTVRSGMLEFWGEWEPQSRVVETFPRGLDGGPSFLHEPFWQRPRHRAAMKNTDPLVFGSQFLYSNCRQARNRKLRELAPGSIVLFGSKRRSEFVLDTVFVVGEGAAYSRGSSETIPCEDWVQAVVFEPMRLGDRPASESFRLYRGRTANELPDGPFSFVPCLPCHGGGIGFARPVIRLDRRWIEPNLAMGAKATPATQLELRALWDEVVHQVVDVAELCLGVQLKAQPAAASTP